MTWRVLWTWVVGCALGGCSPGPIVPPVDTDPSVAPEAPTGCDFGAFAGIWRGDVYQDNLGWWDCVMNLDATAEIDAKIGTILWATHALPPDRCLSELFCTGRKKLGWDTTVEIVVDGDCVDEYSFFRLETDGSLSYEFAFAEFEDDVGRGTLTRVD